MCLIVQWFSVRYIDPLGCLATSDAGCLCEILKIAIPSTIWDLLSVLRLTQQFPRVQMTHSLLD